MFLRESTIAPFFQYALYFAITLLVLISTYYIVYIGNKVVGEKYKINIKWKNIAKLLGAVMLLLIISYLFRKYPILGSTTFALFVSVILAFLLNPIVNRLERKGIKRGYGTIISYLVILLVIVFLFVSIIPELINQISLFLSNLPSSIDYTYDYLIKQFDKWNIDYQVLTNLRTQLNDYLIGLSNNIPEWTTQFINAIQGSLGTIVTLVLIPLIAYHLIVSKDRIIFGIYGKLPSSIKHDALYLYREINFALNGFVKSRLLMAAFIGFSTGLMLQLFGIPFAWVIGFITMIMDIVPYIGPVLATAPALIFAFIKSPVIFVIVAILCWLLQWIEQNIVGAKLFSDSSGIHELIILLSIIVGGGMFGVWGMILSVPVVLIIKIFIEYFTLKAKGIKPEFTKDVEQALIREMNKKEKEKKKQRARQKKAAQKINKNK